MCELCNLEVKTKLYGENNSWIVTDCLTCHVPMFVLKRHSRTVSRFELENALVLLNVLELPGELDFERRNIKDHFHFHVRK